MDRPTARRDPSLPGDRQVPEGSSVHSGPVRYGAHRTGHSVVAALLPSLLAVAAVAALITALAVWQAEEPSRTEPAAAGARTGGDAGSSAVESTSPDESASPAESASPDESASPAESASPEPGTAESASPAESASGAAAFDIEVVVLNQSSRPGLAAAVAEELRAAGWAVPFVGNFTGVVPATTVYYLDGTRKAARAVAGDLSAKPRLRPRFGNLSTTRLTVVVTDSYPR